MEGRAQMTNDFPEIRPEALIGAKLYADRRQMVANLGIPRGGIIAEVGVAHGDFTDFLVRELQPAHFYALDLFEMERHPVHWGVPQEVLFQGKTHHDFYRDRFAHLGERLTIMRGLSIDTTPQLPDAALEMIYIDAAHDYTNVSKEGAICARKIKPGGLLIFNDYVLYDPFNQTEYGVIPAVNEMLATGDWRVAGFALQRHMFCDMAIRRAAQEKKVLNRVG
jgi:hypothetical protein